MASKKSLTHERAARRPTRERWLLFAVACLALLLAPPAHGRPGELDRTFGMDGRVTTTLGDAAGLSAAAVQPDGRVVIGGSYREDWARKPFLLRYLPDGSLDSSFGAGGVVAEAAVSSGALAVQPDGRVVAAGGRGTDMAVARYNSDGSLDPSFGTGGVSLVPFAGRWSGASSVVVAPDGSLTLAGGVSDPPSDACPRGCEDHGEIAVVRLSPSGRPDPRFGDGGRVTTSFGPVAASAAALVAQPDGRLVVAGSYTGEFAEGSQAVLVRYLADGSLDPSFGNEGRVRERDAQASDVVLQSDGRLVVGGVGALNDDFWLVRYLADGSRDPSFGRKGRAVSTGRGPAGPLALALQPDGSVIAAGTNLGSTAAESRAAFALARYRTDGTVDRSWAREGVAETRFRRDPRATTFLSALALGSDQRLVAGGFFQGHDNRLALARYHTVALGRLGAVARRIKARSFARRGLGAVLRCSQPCEVTIQVTLTRRSSRRAPMRQPLASSRGRLAAAQSRRLIARPTASTRSALRRLQQHTRATLRVRFIGSGRAPHVIERSVLLRR